MPHQIVITIEFPQERHYLVELQKKKKKILERMLRIEKFPLILTTENVTQFAS